MNASIRSRLLAAVPLALVALSACESVRAGFNTLVFHGTKEWGPRTSDGKQTGEWKYWHDAGHLHVRAIGTFEDDLPNGHWTYFDESGAKRWETSYSKGALDGESTAWFANGKQRSHGTYRNGLEDGEWTYWNEDGSKQSSGSFVNGVRDGQWAYWKADGSELARVSFAHGVPSDAQRDGTTAEPAATQPARIAESDKKTLPAEIAKVVEPIPRAGVVAVPLTTLQEGQAQSDKSNVTAPSGYDVATLATIYETGKEPPGGGGSHYGAGDPRNPPTEPRRDAAKSDPFVKKPLPTTRITREDGTSFDLATLQGRSSVLLVVLRGMSGRICEYCLGQTIALQKTAADFKRAGCEIVLVYPGANERLDEFVGAVRKYEETTYGSARAKTECMLACDAGFGLVDSLGIRKDLAIPSAFVIDKQGIVQFAWVGKNPQDRPCADRLLEEVRKLK